ncbi:MAG: hypothetical protein HY925_16520 [Elusimicrobia bacterium]|nr:hypothetical protein [Elusimicrobiota bacterium]
MTRFVSSYSAIADASGNLVPYRDSIVFAAALLAMFCLGAAIRVWISSRRMGWIPRLNVED